MNANFKTSVVSLLGAVILMALAHTNAFAQNWPDRTIRMIVPGAAGASADALARTMAELLGRRLGVGIVVENRVGASGVIGADAVAKSAPDGYTLLFAQQDSQVLLPLLKQKLPYDTEKDFVPIAKVGDLFLLFATNSNVPAADMKAFIALAKERPGTMNLASGGAGGINHLVSELLTQRAGIRLAHIPYKGGTPAATALVAGEVHLFGGSYALLGKFIDAGRLRGLAVTGESRLPNLPNVPTMAEVGYPDFIISAWYGVFAPAGLPEPIAARLSAELVSAFNTQEYQRRLVATGGEGRALDRVAFAQFMRAETNRWREVIAKGNITVDQ